MGFFTSDRAHNQNWREANISENVLNSFKNKQCAKKLFFAGNVFYRFGTLGHTNRMLDGDFWFTGDTRKKIAEVSKRTGIPPLHVARHGLAITFEWNESMDSAVVMTLKEPVYGWLGEASSQNFSNEYADLNTDKARYELRLIGGFEQVYFPNIFDPKKMQFYRNAPDSNPHPASPVAEFSNHDSLLLFE